MTIMDAVPPAPKPLLAEGRGPRIALASVTPLGPLAMAVWALSTPYEPGASAAAAAAAITEDPVGTQWGLLMLLAAGGFGAIGTLVIAVPIRAAVPRLGAVGAALGFCGFVNAAYPGPVAAIAAAPAAGIDPASVLVLAGAVDGQVQGAASAALFITLPAGVLLLGIAAVMARRRRRYPTGAAILLVASMPLVLGGGFVSGDALAAGWVVLGVAYGLAAREYARSPVPSARRTAGVA